LKVAGLPPATFFLKGHGCRNKSKKFKNKKKLAIQTPKIHYFFGQGRGNRIQKEFAPKNPLWM